MLHDNVEKTDEVNDKCDDLSHTTSEQHADLHLKMENNKKSITHIRKFYWWLNSFLFLSSVKKIVEHREIKNPTSHTDDFKLKSTDENHAPITLVRLLIAKKPLSEKQICNEILKLSAFSGVLAVITAFMMLVII